MNRASGWWGMVVFVATEATLFGALVGTYVYLRFLNAHWPPAGVGDPAVLKPALLTLALVATSGLMQASWASAREWDRQAAWRFLFVAFVIQVIYLAWQLHDYVHSWHTMHPQASAYSSVYLTLLGLDHLHVLAGVLMSAWLLMRLWSRITRYRAVGLHAVTFYWHAVNAITIVVLLVQVSPHL